MTDERRRSRTEIMECTKNKKKKKENDKNNHKKS